MIFAPRHAQLVADALPGIGNLSGQPPQDRWNLSLTDTSVSAQIDGDWLLLSARGCAEVTAGELLAQNATLPGLIKRSAMPDGTPIIRAEVPLDEEAGPLIRDAWNAIEIMQSMRDAGSDHAVERASESSASQDDLLHLCCTAGWPATARNDGSCVVELECPDAFIPASLAAHHGGVRASVSLATFADATPESISALASFLLEAGSVVRMARPVMETADGKTVARFEVVFSAIPTASQLAHAFSALSVAARLCAEEAKVLLISEVAGEYLALRGGPEGPLRQNSKTNRKETA